MFGIEDPCVWMAYLLSVASTLLCIVYGAINWNRGDDTVQAEDFQWIAEERKVEEET